MIASHHQAKRHYVTMLSICMYSVLGTHQTEFSKTTPTNLDKYLLDFLSWEGGAWDQSCVLYLPVNSHSDHTLAIFMDMKLVRPIMYHCEVAVCTGEKTGLSEIKQEYVQTDRQQGPIRNLHNRSFLQPEPTFKILKPFCNKYEK